MRTAFRIFAVLSLAVTATPAFATPITYDINFSLSSGTLLPSSGAFSWDPVTSTFTNLDVVFDGYDFPLTSFANLMPFAPHTDACFAGATTAPEEVFDLLTACSSIATWNGEIAVEGHGFYFDRPTGTGNIALGFATTGGAPPPYFDSTGTFAATSVPEPATFALSAPAILCLYAALIRKSIRYV